MQRTVFMCSCAQVSRWSGGHEETSQRSSTRVRQAIDRTPSTPGKTHLTKTKPQKYWLYINWTECFLFFLLLHRISRVLQTKRISNHRNTATFLRCCFIWSVSCDTRTRLCLQDARIIFCIFHFPFKFDFLTTGKAYQAYLTVHVSLCNVLKITNSFELYHKAYPFCSR